jgi:UDP-perosamine 4-acetyltransferase
MTLKKINFVIGAGGHARTVLENLYIQKKKNINLYDIRFYNKNKNYILENKVIGDFKNIKKNKISAKNNFYLAIGDNKIRKKIFFFLSKKKAPLPNLISKTSYISNFSNLGFANFINHFSFIGSNVCIGNNNIINTKSLIEHDVKIGSHCHVCPEVKIAGGTSIANDVFIGIGTIIINNIKICSNVTIGAGSLITRDIKYPGTYISYNNKLRKI